jgi:hypothetical protein
MLWKWIGIWIGLALVNAAFYGVMLLAIELNKRRDFFYTHIFSWEWKVLILSAFIVGIIFMIFGFGHGVNQETALEPVKFYFCYGLFALPLIFAANFLLNTLYLTGVSLFGNQRALPIQLTFWSSAPLAFVAVNYFMRGEFFTKGEAIGFALYISGALISIFYK